MKVVVVPDWALNSLALVKKSYTVLSDTSSVLSTLSKEDLSFYDHCLDIAQDVLSPKLKATIPILQPLLSENDTAEQTYDWTLHYTLKGDIQKQYRIEVINGVVAESSRGPFLQMLGFPDAAINDEDSTVVPKPWSGVVGFDLLSEESGMFYIRLKPISRDQLPACYDQLFKVLNKKYDMERLVSMPLFGEYETLLKV